MAKLRGVVRVTQDMGPTIEALMLARAYLKANPDAARYVSETDFAYYLMNAADVLMRLGKRAHAIVGGLHF